MSIYLGVYISPAFAEYCLIDAKRPAEAIGFHRSYTPIEALAQGLKKFLEKYPDHAPSKVLISSHFLEKILDSRLGGTVAQIVTDGLEAWPWLRQSLVQSFFAASPSRTEALATQQLLFGLRERVDHTGKIITPLDPVQLTEIIEKLKAQSVQRVCVNLLFAHRNPTHQEQVKQQLTEAGFDVFCATDSHSDEIQVWRKNILNAALAGTFHELHSALFDSLKDKLDPEQIFYVDSNTEHFQNNNDRIGSSLFAAFALLNKHHQKVPLQLHLGLEKWYLSTPGENADHWISPWGPVALNMPLLHMCGVQPTSEIVLDQMQKLNFAPQPQGYEPGPMMLGRALKPLLFDVLYGYKPINDIEAWVQSSTKADKTTDKSVEKNFARFQQTVLVLLKGASSSRIDLDIVLKDILNLAIDQIGIQALMLHPDKKKNQVQVTGFFASALTPLLQKRWPELQWKEDTKVEPNLAQLTAMSALNRT